jgi:hypothetical protein
VGHVEAEDRTGEDAFEIGPADLHKSGRGAQGAGGRGTAAELLRPAPCALPPHPEEPC